MKSLTVNIFGKLFGDKGYISQALFDLLFEDDIQLITKVRKHETAYLTKTEAPHVRSFVKSFYRIGK